MIRTLEGKSHKINEVEDGIISSDPLFSIVSKGILLLIGVGEGRYKITRKDINENKFLLYIPYQLTIAYGIIVPTLRFFRKFRQ